MVPIHYLPSGHLRLQFLQFFSLQWRAAFTAGNALLGGKAHDLFCSLFRPGIAAADAGAMEDNLVIVHFAATECRAARRGRQVEPRDILDRSTSLADKVMMTA